MGKKMLRRFRFTCLSVSRSGTGKGLFTKGQSVITNEDDPRLPWFRSGGFKEEALPPVEVDDGIADPGPDEANKDGGDGDEDVVTFDTPLAEVEGIREDVAERLAEANVVTVANALSAGLEGLMAVEGVGEKTAQKIMKICEAVSKPE